MQTKTKHFKERLGGAFPPREKHIRQLTDMLVPKNALFLIVLKQSAY